MTWTSDSTPPVNKLTGMGWLRAFGRGGIIAIITFGGLGLLLFLRLFERPLFGADRPITPYITQFVCKAAFRVMGIGMTTQGKPMVGAGAVVANHTSWLDIFALNAAQQIYFVAKSEVAKWPGIGWLARATGTVFISRVRTHATQQVALFRERIGHGHRLLFFPEGTSTDGRQVLPFKPTLFASFFDETIRENLAIQPVSVIYSTPKGADPRTYAWWGDMDFGPHLFATLAQSPQGRVTVIYHSPVKVSDFTDRKTLATHLETLVRQGHEDGLTH